MLAHPVMALSHARALAWAVHDVVGHVVECGAVTVTMFADTTLRATGGAHVRASFSLT